MNYLESSVLGESLGIGGQASSVPSIIAGEFTVQVGWSLSWKRPQVLHSVWSIPQIISLFKFERKRKRKKKHHQSSRTPQKQRHIYRQKKQSEWDHGVFASSHGDDISEGVLGRASGLAKKGSSPEEGGGGGGGCGGHC